MQPPAPSHPPAAHPQPPLPARSPTAGSPSRRAPAAPPPAPAPGRPGSEPPSRHPPPPTPEPAAAPPAFLPPVPRRRGTIDLNSVTFEQLREQNLSVTQATRLLAHRERLGGFQSVDDLDQVAGFPGDLLADLKSRSTV